MKRLSVGMQLALELKQEAITQWQLVRILNALEDSAKGFEELASLFDDEPVSDQALEAALAYLASRGAIREGCGRKWIKARRSDAVA